MPRSMGQAGILGLKRTIREEKEGRGGGEAGGEAGGGQAGGGQVGDGGEVGWVVGLVAKRRGSSRRRRSPR